VSATYANTASVINANCPTLFSALNLITNQFLSLNIFLVTTSTLATPILTSTTVGYSWTNTNPTGYNSCAITAYLADIAGNSIIPSSTAPVTLLVAAPYGFFHSNTFIEPFTKSFNFDNTGKLTATLMETQTPGVQLTFSLIYWDGLSMKTTRLFNAVVPNQPSINLSNLSSPIPYDFG
jgi:hypothetical protein